MPVITPGPRPSSSAIARAVTVWSPVIIRTSIPASSATRTASLGLGAQRVDDADERDQHEVGHRRHRVGERRGHRGVVEVAGGERQHPQPTLGQLPVGGEDLVADRADRHLLAVPQRRARTAR